MAFGSPPSARRNECVAQTWSYASPCRTNQATRTVIDTAARVRVRELQRGSTTIARSPRHNDAVRRIDGR